MKVHLIFAIVFILMVENCLTMGLLRGLGLYGSPMMGAPGYGCSCPASVYGYGSGFALSKTPSLNLGYPSSCCLSLSKPCLLTKLYLLKKKLLEKKMNLLGCGCGCSGAPLPCGFM